jgi:hypothetical protein
VIGLFFPQRESLRIDGSSFSPGVLKKNVLVTAHTPSYAIGSKMLEVVGDVSISSRGLNKQAVKIGVELVEAREARTDEYFDQPLPERRKTQPVTPIPLAVVSCDGGRMQTRLAGGGKGVHNPAWRETKNAIFLRMKSSSFDVDPHPGLPGCFRDRARMKALLSGVDSGIEGENPGAKPPGQSQSEEDDWRPEKQFRTCLSSLCDSDAFGRLMEVEADSRGFYQAKKQAFVSDGLPYNWTIQERHFPTFTPVLDFVHPLERVYESARSVTSEESTRWDLFVRRAQMLWQGDVEKVLEELRTDQERIGLPPADCEEKDPRKIVADTIRYLETNASRMQYPDYRRQGLPVTSAHMESYVKEVNYRVKSTSKFFDDGASGEAILEIRSQALCDDNRLERYLDQRPGHLFSPNSRKPPSLAIAN